MSARQEYPQAQLLPLPSNIDQSETIRFSPLRYRDINSSVIVSHNSSASFNSPIIDVTVDSTTKASATDPHVASYDCNGAVNLNSAMQSNVPSPFGGMHKFTHLNMPGGQWGQVQILEIRKIHYYQR